MNSAEQEADNFFDRANKYQVENNIKHIKRIQRDAWKQGMIDAAAIAERFGGDINDGQGCGNGCDTSISMRILDASKTQQAVSKIERLALYKVSCALRQLRREENI